MAWFKVDDGLAFHEKVVAAGNAAMGLWVRAGAWSSDQMRDGFIPAHMAALLGTETQARKLVQVRLWHEVEGGYSFHEWEERNPKREQIEAERAAGAERKRLSRARRNGKAVAESLVNGHSHAEASPDAEVGSQRTDPTRPDPIETTDVVSGPRKRGTRLPDEFIPSESSRQTILAENPSIDMRREHSKFVDHWTAQPGQRGVKLDWDATWRNWMRRAGENDQRPAEPPRPKYLDAEPPDYHNPDAIQMTPEKWQQMLAEAQP